MAHTSACCILASAMLMSLSQKGFERLDWFSSSGNVKKVCLAESLAAEWGVGTAFEETLMHNEAL